MEDEESLSGSDGDQEREILEARRAVEKNPGAYDAHLKLVGLLRTQDFGELRTARLRFADAFPLPSPVWLQWIEDEARISVSAAERSFIAGTLFRRAMADYVSVPITLAFIRCEANRLSLGDIDMKAFVEAVESLIGDHASAMHVYGRGGELWDVYEEILDKMGAQDALRDAREKRKKSPCARITLRAIEPGSDEQSDIASPDGPNIEDKREQRKAFESKLADAGSNPEEFSGLRPEDLLARYASYAVYEAEHAGEASNVIWERCVAECFLMPQAWLQFANHFRAFRNVASERAVLNRAVRNVPWSTELWTRLLVATSCSGLDGAREQIRTIAETAIPHVQNSNDETSVGQFGAAVVACVKSCATSDISPEELEDMQVLLRPLADETTLPWAEFCVALASVCRKDTDVGKFMEPVILARPHEARWWVSYAAFLCEQDHKRLTYRRGLAHVGDANEARVIADAWLLFEQQHGNNPAKLVEAQENIQAVLGRRMPSTHTSQYQHGAFADPTKATATRKRGPQHITRKPRKQRRDNTGEASSKSVTVQDAKDSKRNPANRNPAKTLHTRSGEPAVADLQQSTVPENTQEGGGDVPAKTAQKRDRSDGADQNDAANTAETYEASVVFVNNLSYSATESELARLFEPAGAVREIRLPRRVDGAPKGFAYVEFASDETVPAALALHKSTVCGREIWVRRSKPPKPKPARRNSDAVQDAANDTDNRTDSSTPSLGQSNTEKRKHVILHSRKPKLLVHDSDANDKQVPMDVSQVDDPPNVEHRAEQKPLGQDAFRAMLQRK